jgi:antitoxin component YwqK of YwqJK toxin-antitoxin module
MKSYTRITTWRDLNVMFETPIVNGRWHGLRIVYFRDYKVYSKTPYKNNLEHGADIEFKY